MSVDLYEDIVQYYNVQKLYYRTIKLQFYVETWLHNVGT